MHTNNCFSAQQQMEERLSLGGNVFDYNEFNLSEISLASERKLGGDLQQKLPSDPGISRTYCKSPPVTSGYLCVLHEI